MKNKFPLLLAALTMISSTLIAAQSELNAVWYDRMFDHVPLKNVLIVGLSDDPDKRLRFETGFVDVVRQKGGKAETSLSVLPPNSPVNKEAVKAAIKDKGFDSVLVCRLASIDLATKYVPGKQTQRTPKTDNPYNASFDQDYQRMYDSVTTPGYLHDSKTVIMQLRLFAASGKLIWSAESETFDPLSLRDLIRSLGDAIQKDLTDKGLLKPNLKP